MKKKFINVILSVLLLVLTFSLVGCQKVDKVNQENLFIDKIEEKGVHLSVRRNAQSDNDSITITAYVTPSDATNKKLNWVLDCDDDNFSDSNNLEDFLDLNVSSDTLSATINYLAPFPVQLKVIVSSQANPNIFASCSIDCYERIFSIDYIDIDVTTTTGSFAVVQNDNVFYFSSLTYDHIMSLDTIIEISNIEYQTKGTIDISDYASIRVKWNDNVINLAEENYGSIDNLFSTEYFTIYDNQFNIKLMMKDYALYESYSEEVISVLQETPYWFTVEVTATTNNEINFVHSMTKQFILGGFDISNIPVSSIILDETSITL